MQKANLFGFSPADAEKITYRIHAEKPPVTRISDALLIPAVPDPKKGSFLYGVQGGVLDADGRFVEASGQWRDVDDLCLFVPDHHQPSTTLRDTAEKGIFGGVIFDHFGHFLLESLSRLWLPLEDRGLDEWPIFFLTFGVPLRRYHWEFFRALGIADRVRIVRLPTQVHDLIVPGSCIRYQRTAFQAFRTVFDTLKRSAPVGTTGSRKLYVSRLNVESAVTVPEEAIEDMFRRDGWDVVHPELMSISQQISLFRGAQRVAGLTGSGMHNVLYCDNVQQVVNINRFPVLLDIFFVLDELFSLPSLYINACKKTELEPFDAAGPFLLDVEAVHSTLLAEGILSARSSVQGYRAAEQSDYDRFVGFWHHKRSQILNFQGRVPEATDSIEAAIGKIPDCGSFYLQLSACRHSQGDALGAVQAASEAIRLGYCTPEVFRHLTELLMNQNRFVEAGEKVQEGLRINPENPVLLALLARAVSSPGNYTEALAYSERAVAAAPDHPMIRYNLAHQLFNCKRLAEARDQIEEAIRLDPGLVESRILRSRILIELGELDLALEGAIFSVNLAPNSREAATFMGEFLEVLGRVDEAKIWLQRGSGVPEGALPG